MPRLSETNWSGAASWAETGGASRTDDAKAKLVEKRIRSLSGLAHPQAADERIERLGPRSAFPRGVVIHPHDDVEPLPGGEIVGEDEDEEHVAGHGALRLGLKTDLRGQRSVAAM